MALPIINVEKKKLDIFLDEVWSPKEAPIVVVPCEYRYKPSKKSLRNGFVMITKGAVYFFKSKFFGDPLLDTKVHILDMRTINVETDYMEIDFDDYKFEIKSKNVSSIYAGIYTIFSEMTFGLSNVKGFTVNASVPLPQIVISKRPEKALMWRSLFLAHFYGIEGQQLETMSYFENWEEKNNPLLVLGGTLHPGNFAAAFGHAIGWEPLANSVCFQAFAPSKFPRMIQSIIENSQKIERLVFADYKPNQLPKFCSERIVRSNVKRYWIMRSVAKLTIDFCNFAKYLPNPIEELSLYTTPYNKNNLEEITDIIKETPQLREMKKFGLIRIVHKKKFPISTVTRLVSILDNLTTLTFKGLEVSGSDILSLVCTVKNTKIEVLNITHMQFRSGIASDLTLPESIVRLNLSSNAFAPSSFRGLISLIIERKPKEIPIILQLAGLIVKPGTYKKLEEFDFNNVYPNIAEFDFSNNIMPNEEQPFFFRFLYSQKRLRLVRFEEMSADDPITFLRNVMALVTSMQLPALEVSGRIDAAIMNSFVRAMPTNMPFLRRLGLRNMKGGSEGLTTIAQAIAALPNLVEVLIDGQEPTDLESLIAGWAAVARSPTVQSCDLPLMDAKALNLEQDNLPQGFQEVIDQLMLKKRPTTMANRSVCMAEQLKDVPAESRSAAIAACAGPDIFAKTIEMNLVDMTEDFELDQEGAKPAYIDE